jgi:acetyl-CoA C-acetyltransferase
MRLDPRLPVIVGVGQVNHEGGDSPEPVELLAEAARRAEADSGGRGVLAALESVRIVNLLSRRYPDPGALVANRLGIDVGETIYTTAGGQTPQTLIDRSASTILAGDLDAVLIGGAEAWKTRNRYRSRGERADWTVQSDGTRPSRVLGTELNMTDEDETSLGLVDPIQVYPMFEHALRAQAGRSVEAQIGVAAGLWARFSEVAATNPYAAIPQAYRADEIAAAGPANRMVGFPYPKLMNANNNVDQAAAIIMCSVEAAGRLGVPADRWVFLHGAAEANDAPFVSHRHDLANSPAIRLAGAAVLAGSRIGIDEVAHIDLYSCFPSAVQVAAAALGLDLDRQLTVTGGLTFAGGPWNDYVTHAVATMVGVLRTDPTSIGLCTANGGLLTKHAVGVYSCQPPTTPVQVESVQSAVDALPTRAAAPGHSGTATIETYTVMYDRAGHPHLAFVFCLLDDGRRTLATSDDTTVVETLVAGDPLGRTATVRAGMLLGVV